MKTTDERKKVNVREKNIRKLLSDIKGNRFIRDEIHISAENT